MRRTFAFLALIFAGASLGITTAQPKEAIRIELIRLQEQTGLTLAAFDRDDLAVVLFASRSFSHTGYHIDAIQRSAISPDGVEVATLLDRAFRSFATSALDGSSRRDYPEAVRSHAMCWSHDGSQILLSVVESFEPFHMGLQILDVKSRTTRNIDSSAFVFITQQCWSPDGKRFVYETQEPRRQKKDGSSETVNASVKIFDIDYSKIQELAKGSHPTWSPDGKWIAFVNHDSYYAMIPTGDGQKVLFHKDRPQSGLLWSPDSRIVAYVSTNGFFERPIIMDVEPVRLRVRRLSDNSEDWLAQLYSTSMPDFQWLENKDLISRAQSKNAPK